MKPAQISDRIVAHAKLSNLLFILGILGVLASYGCGSGTDDPIGQSNLDTTEPQNDTTTLPPADVILDTSTANIPDTVDTHTTVDSTGTPGNDTTGQPTPDTHPGGVDTTIPDSMTCDDSQECPPDAGNTDINAPDTTNTTKQSCAVFGECLAQFGCECQLGKDCPPPGSVDYESCQAKCAKQPGCTAACFQSLDPDTHTRFVALQTCGESKCSDVKGNDATTACLKSACLEEYAACYSIGSQSCLWFYSDCAVGCKSAECLDKCAAQLSSDEYLAMVTWDQCRFGLCDQNQDGQLDSNTCSTLIAYTSCAPVSPGCIPPVFSGISTCGDAVSCLTQCNDWTDLGCLSGCLTPSPDAITPLGALLSCVVVTCGGGANLTAECLSTAMAQSCAKQAQTCL